MMERLDGKVAIVSSAAQGLNRAFCLALVCKISDNGIRVNAVVAGLTQTEGQKALLRKWLTK